MKRTGRKKRIATIIAVFLCTAAGLIWYVSDVYESDETVQKYLEKNTSVQITEIENGLFLDGSGNEAALIFYPGAKVEYTAYIPMLYQLAEKGADVFLLKMPCNLSFLGRSRADDILEEYAYDHWYMGGHSLGGAMAASYASEHLKELDGLILLAAYPTGNLNAEGFSVLSVYGSEDGVLNRGQVEKGRVYMPKDYTELCIKGGNHAQFGNYGIQDKDGIPLLSAEEQQEQTVSAICKLMKLSWPHNRGSRFKRPEGIGNNKSNTAEIGKCIWTFSNPCGFEPRQYFNYRAGACPD